MQSFFAMPNKSSILNLHFHSVLDTWYIARPDDQIKCSVEITVTKSAKSTVKNCLKCTNSVTIVVQPSIFVLMTQSYHTFQPKKTIAMLILYFSNMQQK